MKIRVPRCKGASLRGVFACVLAGWLGLAHGGIADTLEPARVADAPVIAVASFAQPHPPSAAQLAALRALGLKAQGLRRLPLAFVSGTEPQLARAAASGGVSRIDRDLRIQYLSTGSNAAIGADALHRLGYTGKGVRVAVVDSGIDATHPDLADHVPHNFKVVQAAFLDENGGIAAPADALFVAFDEGPYSNTDLGSGHGTAVAAVLAADGTTAPELIGVAPDAELIGYGIGTGDLFIGGAAAIMAYDHMLDHPELAIDVVNNSFGLATFGSFDPGHPLHVATRALSAAGITVVFAAGNSGAGDAEMTLSPYALAPWVVSVAGSTVVGARWVHSSNGLLVDNSDDRAPVAGHLRFEGDRLGLYRPTVAAPGADIPAFCSLTGGTRACTAGDRRSSGTSFAAPHVAGLAALLLQARPGLTPEQLRRTLEATARSTREGAGAWQVGFGIVDAPAALALVQHPGFAAQLAKRHREAEARLLADRDWSVLASDLWSWPSYTEAGAIRTVSFGVADQADAVKVTLGVPNPGPGSGSMAEYVAVVSDASGRERGRTALTANPNVSSVLIDLRDDKAAPGPWQLRLEGSTITTAGGGYEIVLQAAALRAQERVAQVVAQDFTITGTLPFALKPDASRATGLRSPEDCEVEPGEPIGVLAPGESEQCHSGLIGYAVTYDNPDAANRPGEFVSMPFADTVTIGGPATLVVYYADPARETGQNGSLNYELDEITADGTAIRIDANTAFKLFESRNTGVVVVPPHAIVAGHRLRLRLRSTNYTTSAGRLLFGGAEYGDAGIILSIGKLEEDTKGRPAKADTDAGAVAASAGAIPAATLAFLVLALLLGVRRGRSR
jgi:serine protease AprX